MTQTIGFTVGGERVPLKVGAEIIRGEQTVLLDHDDDLTAGTLWAGQGYTIAPFLDDEHSEQMERCIGGIVAGLLEKADVPVNDIFRLDKYHEFVSSEQEHLTVVQGFRGGFPADRLPFDKRVIEDRVSEICGVGVTCFNPSMQEEMWGFRISRPGCMTDSNPPHRDVYLDRLRNAVNIYGPIAGSNSRSSLPLIPGSHFWPESEIERTASGATMNGASYTVPCITSGRGLPLDLMRPDPARDEVMVFSPYLVHGGAYNLNSDVTRVSLEMRFWRK